MEFLRAYDLLVRAVRGIGGVIAMGKSGGAVLPERDEGDIDLFVFCDAVPSAQARREAVQGIGLPPRGCRSARLAAGFGVYAIL